MTFIHKYFRSKIGAIGKMLSAIGEYCNKRTWPAAIVMMLYTILVSVLGILLLPIDFVLGAIYWCKSEVARERMESFMDEMILK